MRFTRRLKLFLIGFAIGLLMVFLFFGERSEILTNWMPNARVIDRLQASTDEISETALCQFECYGIEKDSLKNLISKGDINFKESLTQQKPLIYLVEVENYDKELYGFYFSAADSSATLTHIVPADPDASCDCD